MKRSKPILHARDHMPGGADPVPLLSGPHHDYKSFVLAQGPWAYWPLDDSGGGPHDEIAGRDMTAVENYPYLLAYGLEGPFTTDLGALGYSGKDSGVDNSQGTNTHYGFGTGDANEVYGTDGTFTAMVWFYPSPMVPNQSGVVTAEGWIMSYSTGVTLGVDKWAVYQDAGGDLYATLGAVTLSALATGHAPGIGSYNHVALSFDGATVELYLNGGLVDFATATAVTGVGGLQLGRQVYSGGGSSVYFEGRMAHCTVFTTAIGGDRIADLAGTTPGLVSDAPEHMVLEADGMGATRWAYPSIEVDY